MLSFYTVWFLTRTDRRQYIFYINAKKNYHRVDRSPSISSVFHNEESRKRDDQMLRQGQGHTGHKINEKCFSLGKKKVTSTCMTDKDKNTHPNKFSPQYDARPNASVNVWHGKFVRKLDLFLYTHTDAVLHCSVVQHCVPLLLPAGGPAWLEAYFIHPVQSDIDNNKYHRQHWDLRIITFTSPFGENIYIKKMRIRNKERYSPITRHGLKTFVVHTLLWHKFFFYFDTSFLSLCWRH